MAKKHLEYDPQSKSFRPVEERGKLSPNGLPKSGGAGDEKERAPEDATREKPVDADTTDRAQKTGQRPPKALKDKKGPTRQIQVVAWIWISVALSLWIALVAMYFIADGFKLESEAPSVEPESFLGR